MIVPILQLPECGDAEQIDSTSDEIARLGILGRVALRVPRQFDPEWVKQVVQMTGGRIELQIMLESMDQEFAIELLNTGANQIQQTGSTKLDLIPEERIFSKPADSHEELDPHVLATNWKAGKDDYIDSSQLSSQIISDTLCKLLRSDRPDRLWPTVITDPLGIALGLAYSSAESLRLAITDQVGVYFSRSRNEIWVKGATSGATQRLLGIRIDCDFDALRFTVEQGPPGFCHKKTHSCFGYERSIAEVLARLGERVAGEDEKSFTQKLFRDPDMLRKKLLEEAQELSDATSQAEASWEAADVLYFSVIAMMRNGATLPDVYAELSRRMQRVVRRKNKLENE